MSSDRPAVVSSRIKGFLACILVLLTIYFLQSIASSFFTVGFKVINQLGFLRF